MADGKIVTVKGEIEPGQLGVCQSHEHLLLRKGQSYLVNPALFMDEPEKSAKEAAEYMAAGGRALVEAQPVGCGRMAEGLVWIAEQTGLSVIASTGFHKMTFYPEGHWIGRKSRDELRKIFVEELLLGMYGDGDEKEPRHRTAARAGQIKTALDTEGLTPRYRRLFLAAADAAVETGAPLMVHVENGTDPRELLKLLLRAGVPGEQMIFCHMDRACHDLEIHEEVAGSGAYLEYDTIGRFKYHSDEQEVHIIRHMLEAGLGEQLLLSLDTTRQRLEAYGGQIGLTYLLKEFLPLLWKCGVTKEAAGRMLRENPAKAFAWKI